MSSELINHSADLKRLWDEGHSMEILGGFLLVHDVPYVNSSKELKRGTLVTSLVLSQPDKTGTPDTHVINFIGSYPCHIDGSPIKQLFHESRDKELIPNLLKVNHSFSNKPADGFKDYYEKVCSYIHVISNPAKAIDDSITEKTFQVVERDANESVFCYEDTNTSRAEINPIALKLSGQKIAIIGVGGSGSYLLDLLAKTPVEEIHLFDGDYFLQHNAFRAPGATAKNEFSERLKKTDYFQKIYSKMHRHIVSHPVYVEGPVLSELLTLNFIFIAMDSGKAKKDIVNFLTENNQLFIDIGVGVQEVDGALIGKVRVTTSTPIKRDHIEQRISFADAAINDYDRNIQIADLNCLSATLAVIKWKKLFGFYKQHENEHYSTFTIYTNETVNDDIST